MSKRLQRGRRSQGGARGGVGGWNGGGSVEENDEKRRRILMAGWEDGDGGQNIYLLSIYFVNIITSL